MDPFPSSEFTLTLNLDILDAGQSPNAVRVHAETTQVDFEVDRLPPADSPPRDLLITVVKEMIILNKKEFRNTKKSETCSYLSSIWKWWKRENDCETACDCVKRANMVFGLCIYKEIFARKHTTTHKLRQDPPPWFEFLVIFDFFARWYRRGWEASSVKIL